MSVTPIPSPILAQLPESPATPTVIQVNQPAHPTQIDIEQKAKQYWDAYATFVKEWFYEPDLQAVEVVLSALAAHYTLDSDPVWLFVIGPSGGGKTSLCIYPMANSSPDQNDGLPDTHIMGDLTPRTLLSSFTGKKNASFLHSIGSSGILLFKDFTTFLAKRQDDRSAIASQLREIYDGSFKKDSGMGETVAWKGKITIIAAATHALERYWALQKEFGERFMSVRWERKDGIRVAEKARKQIGMETYIRKGLQAKLREFFTMKPSITQAPPLTDAQSLVLSTLAEFTALARTQVAREGMGNRQIIDIPQPEESSRPGKALSSLARYHAALFRRRQVIPADLLISARVAMDSIPLARARILAALPKDHDQAMSGYDLAEQTRMNKTTLDWTVEELRALGVVTEEACQTGDKVYSLSRKIARLWNDSFGSELLRSGAS